MLDFWGLRIYLNFHWVFICAMTIDDRIRYGMLALGAATMVMTAMGLHPLGPLTENNNFVASACGL